MRLATWNCYRGECHERAGQLQHLDPDVIVLQECGRPEAPATDHCLWFGDNPQQGVAVLARNGYRLEPYPLDPDRAHSVFPVQVVGPVSFGLLAVWAMPRPTYVSAVNHGLTAYRDLLGAGPAVVAGDFNSHWQWDARHRDRPHATLVERLGREFGLISAYHAVRLGVEPGDEEPTLYWQWKETQPFHIDYCFVPSAWVPHIEGVRVGAFADWEGKSDHRPVVVDVRLGTP